MFGWLDPVLQVNNLEKVIFVQKIFERFDGLLYTAVLSCRISVQFFDERVNKRDFLKIINLDSNILALST